jgi:hypothetical protein
MSFLFSILLNLMLNGSLIPKLKQFNPTGVVNIALSTLSSSNLAFNIEYLALTLTNKMVL